MKLYTERRGIRAPLEKTYSINMHMYSLLLDCCKRYKKNLTHIFTLNCYHNFTDSNYSAFDEKRFMSTIKIIIPSLVWNDFEMFLIENCDNQYAILDLIEYFAVNIKDISERWNNRYQNYKTIDCFKTSDIFNDFKEEINEIFTQAGLLYELTDEKIIERIVENSPLTKEIENSFAAVDEVGIRELLEDAIALYKTPNTTARQDSVEKIWDAFERLKTYYTTLDKKHSAKKIVDNMSGGNSEFFTLFNDEFKMLTEIGNTYRIRHHETNKINITDVRYYDYLFNRCLSLIALAIEYLM